MSQATRPPRYQVMLHRSLTPDLEASLTDALVAIDAEEFGTEADTVVVNYTVVDEGMWFTAAEPSRSTVVTGTVPVGTPPDRREAILERVGQTVAETLQEDFRDIMVVASDSQSQRG